jgi:hypothetical protein
MYVCMQITLVDQGERFTFKPLLYELLNGTAQSWEVAPTYAQLLAPYPIQFVQVGGLLQGGGILCCRGAPCLGPLYLYAGCCELLQGAPCGAPVRFGSVLWVGGHHTAQRPP